jgi:phenylpyruvate tautomerase PptA (4-oxalocrotonate tautomerase family)
LPTYICTTRENQLTPEQKELIVADITRIHCAATDAPSYFVQVIFETVIAQNYFVGGKPLQHDLIFIYGRIRTGRAMQTKTKMIQDMAEAVGRVARIPKSGVWIYVGELPARHLIEGGHVLPEPGDEDAWFKALPVADREWMQAIGQS